MKHNTGFYANVSRSLIVRKKFKHLRDELPLPYKVIGKQANMSVSTLSQFLNGTRNFNDLSLDRLEPVIDKYLKMLDYTDIN